MKKKLLLLVCLFSLFVYGCGTHESNMPSSQSENFEERGKTIINNINIMLERTKSEIEKTEETKSIMQYGCEEGKVESSKCSNLLSILDKIDLDLKKEHLRYKAMLDGFSISTFMWESYIKNTLPLDVDEIRKLEDELISLYKDFYIESFGSCTQQCENDLKNRETMKLQAISVLY